MCGIVGYIGSKKALPKLITGLKKLEYRGYDSAGVAYLDTHGKMQICKTVGRVSILEDKIGANVPTNIGIGHTRWATHGEVTDINSHPHQVGKITIVHNGILENYQELKGILLQNGYSFKSDTDTEVACAYIDFVYKKRHSSDILDVLLECTKVFVGSYAIVALIEDYPNQLFVMKKDSPLIIGLGDGENYIASDISAYANSASSYIYLKDLEIGVISCDEIQIFRDGKRCVLEIKDMNENYQDSDKSDFQHYMLKEIYDQVELVNIWNNNYFQQNMIKKLPNIKKFKKIQIIGCGTAYHAGLVGKYLLEYYNDIEVNVFIASEYRYQKLFVNKDTLVIVISQSGETADTLACLKRVKELGAYTLGIVNVYDSSIARYVDEVIYTEAGIEVAVASTKAYVAQVYVLGMLALKNAIMSEKINCESIKQSYFKLSGLIDKMINESYSNVINLLKNENTIFYLGRKIDYLTMMEGSLKLKEISYIHSEAMPAGELKHGTISLMENNSKIVVMATEEDIISKTISNIKEVKARGAKVVLLICDNLLKYCDKSCYDEIILIPKTIDLIQPIVNVIPLQMIAYEIALNKGVDIDKPRNLAKSVTVE